MKTDFTYHKYVTDDEFMNAYGEYQKRYASRIRESDRVLVEIVRKIRELDPGRRLSLLDIGCSTGNFLLHVKKLIPNLGLTGADMASNIIADNMKNPALAGISFKEMDILAIGQKEMYDVIVANAVLYLFHPAEFERALASVSSALNPGGWFITFDWFHPFEQDVTILEKSKTHPEGLLIHARPYSTVCTCLQKTGFINPDFRPFIIPIDLEKPDDRTDISTYTVPSNDGKRMLFRGTLYQPWCHLTVQKAA